MKKAKRHTDKGIDTLVNSIETSIKRRLIEDMSKKQIFDLKIENGVLKKQLERFAKANKEISDYLDSNRKYINLGIEVENIIGRLIDERLEKADRSK